MKLTNDKYYTSEGVVNICLDVLKNTIDMDLVTEIIDPSAGCGAFSSKIPSCIAYDIDPRDPSIASQDFLQLDLPYKKGRLIIGNPPFGTRNTLSVKFFKKAILLGDYVAFILPISQLNESPQMYDFDLIKSVDLGGQLYTDRMLRCCFNIYKRPLSGELNSKPNFKLQDVEIKGYRRGGNYSLPIKADIAFNMWGSGVGKIIKRPGQYAQEAHCYIKNEELRQEILSAFWWNS